MTSKWVISATPVTYHICMQQVAQFTLLQMFQPIFQNLIKPTWKLVKQGVGSIVIPNTGNYSNPNTN